MVLVVTATNRREMEIFHTNSVRSETFRKRVGPQLAYVSRSTSQHSRILTGFYHEIGKLGQEMWPDRPSKESPGAGVAMSGSVSVRGFDSSPFQPISGPGGSVRDNFPIFGVSHYPPYLSDYFPIPPVWCMAYFRLILSRLVAWEPESMRRTLPTWLE